MPTTTYQERQSELETYFDRTAAAAWARLTSTAKVSGIRQTVRAGRARMQTTLLGWLPENMEGLRLLDAGCGTGGLALEAARRGADVVAIDLSGTLVRLAEERLATESMRGRIEFRVGDMLDSKLGAFDHVVAMDSLIHYRTQDMVLALSRLAAVARCSLLFTFAPRTWVLTAMHAVGRLFPRADRAPAIEPAGEKRLERLIGGDALLARDFKIGRTRRIAGGFYTSQALELQHR